MNGTVRFLKLLSVVTVTCLSFVSCNDTDDGSYVAPITLGEKIGGQWQLNTITQTDEITGQTLNLTGQFDFATFGMSLNDNGAFTVSGSAPAILPVSGTWKMASNFINSDGSAAKIILNDKVSLTVTAVPTGGDSHLKFKLIRTAKDVAFVSYEYDLFRISNEPTE